MLGLKLSSSTSEAEGMRGRERTGVRLRGLPWSATADDVVNFFGDLQDDIVTGDIHIVLDFLVSREVLEWVLQRTGDTNAQMIYM